MKLGSVPAPGATADALVRRRERASASNVTPFLLPRRGRCSGGVAILALQKSACPRQGRLFQ